MLLSWFRSRWVHFGILLSVFMPSITAASKFPQYSNTSAPISTSTLPSTVTPCASLVRSDYFPESLRTLPASALASITASEFGYLQEIFRSFVRIAGQPSINITAFQSVTSIYSSLQDHVISDLGSSGFAYAVLPILTDPCLLSTCVNQVISQGSSFTAANPSGGLWLWEAQPPCCGQCSVFAKNVEILYWPTPALTPPISTLINTIANLTFVSPSIYAIFSGLGASDKCSTIGANTISALGLSFGPTDLSTSSIPVNPSFNPNFQPLGQWTAINYEDFGLDKCLCTADCEFDPILNTTLTNLCTPQLSIPQQVTELVPAWASCASDLFGTFDPPIALPLVDGLTTPKDTPAQPTPSSPESTTTTPGPTAAPINSPSSPIVNPTSSPQPSNPPLTVINPNPPVQSNPQPVDSSSVDLPPVESTSVNTLPVLSQPSNASPVESESATPRPVESQPATPQPVDSQPANPQPSTLQPSDSQLINTPPSSPAQTSTVPIIAGTPITLASTVITPKPIAGSSSVFILASQTLSPGGSAITVNGATISLSPSGSALIVSAFESGIAATPTAPPVITVGDQTITANSQSGFVIGTQTLVPGGPPITVQGTPILLASGATGVVVEGSTTPVGSIIMSLFSGGSETKTSEGGETATGVAPAEFTGGAAGMETHSVGGLILWMGAMLALVMKLL